MVKKFMAALLAAALFLCSVPVFAEFDDSSYFEDGDFLVSPFSWGTITNWTDTLNWSEDSSVYIYTRAILSDPLSWVVVGDNYDYLNAQGRMLKLQFRFVNNSNEWVRFSSFSFDVSSESTEYSSFLVDYQFDNWVMASATRPTGTGNLVQRWSMFPTEGYFDVAPGQTIVCSGYLLYSNFDHVQQIVTDFSLNSFACQYINEVDNEQSATAGGQQAIEDAINDNHQDTVDQFEQATNPDQAQATTDVDNAASDLESFEDGIFTDINTYKADLDFSLDSWVEASAGLDYVRKIFMIIWNNSPSQIIVLSLMLGLAMYLLGRGPAFQRAEAAAARRERRRRGGD